MPMADPNQQTQSDGSYPGYPKGWRVPMLPPIAERDATKEQWLRQLHWKDIYASPDQPGSLLLLQRPSSSSTIPWYPIQPAATGDLSPLLATPTVTNGATVQLSAPGQRDQAQVSGANGAKQVGEEGEKRPPNVTIQSQQAGTAKKEDEKSPWKFGAKAEATSELNQPSVEFGGKSGRTLKQAAGESLGTSAKHFEKKFPKGKDIGPSVDYTLWDKSGEHTKLEGKGSAAEGNLRAFYGETKGSASGTISKGGAKGEVGGGAEAGLMKGEGSVGNKDGLLKGTGQGRIASAEAKAKLKGELNFKEAEATLTGNLGASAVLLDGEIGGEIRITPRRLWNGIVVSGVNTAAEWFGYEKQLKDIDGYDWGIVLGVTAGGTVGFAAEAEASGGISKKDKKAGVKAGVKLAPGLGGSVKGKADIVW
jgi:hypothetical protein